MPCPDSQAPTGRRWPVGEACQFWFGRIVHTPLERFKLRTSSSLLAPPQSSSWSSSLSYIASASERPPGSSPDVACALQMPEAKSNVCTLESNVDPFVPPNRTAWP